MYQLAAYTFANNKVIYCLLYLSIGSFIQVIMGIGGEHGCITKGTNKISQNFVWLYIKRMRAAKHLCRYVLPLGRTSG